MTTEYQIIWVDDSPDWVNSVLESIREHISGYGFVPSVKRLANGDEFQKLCSSMDVDLVVVDYNLPDERNGDELIKQLHGSGVFKEVVFYSLNQIPESVVLATEHRVHQTIRDDAVEKIKSVIDLTIYKRRDLEVVRGLIIATTIDLEVKLEELMVALFGENGAFFQEKVLENPWFDFAKKVMFVQSCFKDVIDNAGQQDKIRLKDLYDKFKKFIPDVVIPRNILAHARQKLRNGKVILESHKGKEKIVFDEEWISETRQKLREHMGNLQEIELVLRK